LSPLSADDRAEVLGAARSRRFDKGEVVFHEGDPAESFHLLRSGRLAVRVSSTGGDTATLSVLSPGDAFGELALLHESHEQTATVVALEPAETLSLRRVDVEALRRRNPGSSSCWCRSWRNGSTTSASHCWRRRMPVEGHARWTPGTLGPDQEEIADSDAPMTSRPRKGTPRRRAGGACLSRSCGPRSPAHLWLTRLTPRHRRKALRWARSDASRPPARELNEPLNRPFRPRGAE
jgi:hypothetical protein